MIVKHFNPSFRRNNVKKISLIAKQLHYCYIVNGYLDRNRNAALGISDFTRLVLNKGFTKTDICGDMMFVFA